MLFKRLALHIRQTSSKLDRQPPYAKKHCHAENSNEARAETIENSGQHGPGSGHRKENCKGKRVSLLRYEFSLTPPLCKWMPSGALSFLGSHSQQVRWVNSELATLSV